MAEWFGATLDSYFKMSGFISIDSMLIESTFTAQCGCRLGSENLTSLSLIIPLPAQGLLA